MKIHNVEQGTPEWLKLRLGVPTASEFDKIITPKKAALSSQAGKYACKLIAEKLLNRPAQSLDGLQYIERGKELEPDAVAQYEFSNGVATDKVGFITTDDGLIGASPDRLLRGNKAGLEVKCPAAHTHMFYLLEGHDEAYTPQVQGQIYVAEFDYADFYSYHPRMPPAEIKTWRDAAYIMKLVAALDEFNDKLFAMIDRARSLGVFQAYEEVVTPIDAERGDQKRAAERRPEVEGMEAWRGEVDRQFENGEHPF